jgi:hypothetical protein
MSTLSLLSTGNYSVPDNSSWYLADLDEFRGKQEFYTRQSPQRLKPLREVALSECAMSSMKANWPKKQYVQNMHTLPRTANPTGPCSTTLTPSSRSATGSTRNRAHSFPPMGEPGAG